MGMTDFPQLTLVNYAEVRDDLRSGDILIASGEYAFSVLIKKATASVWSHVGILLRVPEIDRVLVSESIEGQGVRLIALSEYVRNFEDTGRGYKGRIAIARHKQFEAVATPDKMVCMGQVAVDRLGYKYPDEEIAKITLRIIAGSLGLEPSEAPRGEHDICSEHGERILNVFGLPVPHDPRGFCAPSDFGRHPEIEQLWEIETVQAIPT